jgi:ATP-dependent DNA helicase RecQ
MSTTASHCAIVLAEEAMAGPSAPASPAGLLRTLQTRFGHADFRPGQLEAIGTLLAGRDALVVMPTGAGKSLVYQLASLHLRGTTLVVSPLIALMQDQVASLDRLGLRATFINSSLTATEQRARVGQMTAGHYDLVYVSPERLRYEHFMQALGQTRVGLLAVDEAHCISQWGHDFRPDYRRIAQTARALGGPTMLAATATATPRVKTDIIDSLGLRTPFCMMTGYDRPNLRLSVCRAETDDTRLAHLRELLLRHSARHLTRAVIVYCGTREGAETVSAFANEVCGLHASYYHAGLPDRTRLARQQAFINGDLNIIAATNAFGMGIDRPDVGLVVHLGIPGTLEAYYQEAGRAGRDGQPSEAVLLYAPSDRTLQEWFIASDRIERGVLRAVFDGIQSLGPKKSDSTVRFTTARLSDECHLPESRLRVGLDLLEQAAIVERPGDRGFTISVVPHDWDEAVIADLESRYEEHYMHRYAALETMIAYAETAACRRHAILTYFGDLSRPVHDRCCDNCDLSQQRDGGRYAPEHQTERAASVSPAAFASVPGDSPARREAMPSRAAGPSASLGWPRGRTPEKRTLDRVTILHALQAERWPIGRNRLAAVVQGGRPKDFEAKGYARNPYYGALRSQSQKRLRQEIDAMVADGLLTRSRGQMPVLKLTEAGREFADRETRVAGPGWVSPAPLDPGAQPAASGWARTGRQDHAGPRNAPASDLLTTNEIIDRLQDSSLEVRRLAIGALGNRREAVAVDALVAFINGQQPPDLMLSAIRALQQIGGAAARHALATVAGSEHPRAYVTIAALQALRSLDAAAVSASDREIPAPGGESPSGPPEPVNDGATQPARACPGNAVVATPTSSEIRAFLQRPHNQQLEGNWDLGWALDHHGRHVGSLYTHTVVGSALEELKYRQRQDGIAIIRNALRALLASEIELAHVDIIVPVPSTEKREIDPVAVLARIMSDLTGLPVERLLLKTRATRAQKDLHTLAEKRRNVDGAFAVRGSLEGRAILVVDDLYDSGETLREVTRVLRRAGATRVHVLTATRTIHSEG